MRQIWIIEECLCIREFVWHWAIDSAQNNKQKFRVFLHFSHSPLYRSLPFLHHSLYPPSVFLCWFCNCVMLNNSFCCCSCCCCCCHCGFINALEKMQMTALNKFQHFNCKNATRISTHTNLLLRGKGCGWNWKIKGFELLVKILLTANIVYFMNGDKEIIFKCGWLPRHSAG